MTSRVEPRLSRGLRDLLPEQALVRQRMIDTIRDVYERYGYVPLHTPAIEFLDVLSGSGGQEVQQSIFRVSNPDLEEGSEGRRVEGSKGKDKTGPSSPSSPQTLEPSNSSSLGLRFDLTVPLARVVSQYPDLPRPFRRYQVASVWRADKPDPGRFREFTQFDIDAVGVSSEAADTETLAAMCDTLSALNVGAFRVRFSSRRVLNLLLRYAAIAEQRAPEVFRVLDKLDKLGIGKVRLELTTGYKDESGAMIPGLGLSVESVGRIERFLAIQGESRETVLAHLDELFRGVEGAVEEVGLLRLISSQLYELGYGDDRVTIDPSIARGLAYYTGTVFEAVLSDAPQFGSVMGGGRYDHLVARFLGEPCPAVGASIGVDRLLAAMVELKRVSLRRSTAQVLVTTIDPTLMSDYFKMTFELRRAGIRTEMYLGGAGRFGKQVKYADRCGVPIVLVYGSDEKAAGVVTVKDMAAGRAKTDVVQEREAWLEQRPGQFQTSRDRLVDEIQALLQRISGKILPS